MKNILPFLQVAFFALLPINFTSEPKPLPSKYVIQYTQS